MIFPIEDILNKSLRVQNRNRAGWLLLVNTPNGVCV